MERCRIVETTLIHLCSFRGRAAHHNHIDLAAGALGAPACWDDYERRSAVLRARQEINEQFGG
jgi:hypothetical protein